jgi:hypothetical protein
MSIQIGESSGSSRGGVNRPLRRGNSSDGRERGKKYDKK